MTRLGWWHCAAGASGDMCLGALVDAGVELPVLQAAVDAVGVEPVRLSAAPVRRAGLGATRVTVEVAHDPAPRDWGRLRGLLESAGLAEPVRAGALATFARLAEAEARVHRVPAEQVHFHEVGALDAVADVVGTVAGLHALGLDRVHGSRVALGGGTAGSEHGLLPVPGPAVLELLRAAGAPVHAGPAEVELCTPTGAALLAATVQVWGGLPRMTVAAVGTGAGGRDLPGVPNVLRLVVGTATDGPAAGPPAEDLVVLEANVDDLDPRLWPGVLQRLLAAGAVDAWLSPVLMKKGRPAHTVHALADPALAPAVRATLFTETSTIGVRAAAVRRHALPRETVTVEVDGQPVRVKLSRLDGEVTSATPEWDDVAAAAAALGRPARQVLAAASAAAHRLGAG